MYLNRGNKLWQGFFLVEHREKLEELQKKEEPFQAELTEESWQEIQYVIEESLVGEYPVLCEYIKDGKLQSFCGFVEHIHQNEKWLLLSNGTQQRRIDFAQSLYDKW